MAHSEETKRKIGLANKGKLLGIKRNLESVRRGAIKKTTGSFFLCLRCEKKFWRAISAIKKGQNKYCSKVCYQKHQKGVSKNSGFKLNPLVGSKNKNWKGGITPITILIRNSKKYKDWRRLVFERDDYTCQDCKARSKKGLTVYLEAHHKKPFATHPELRFDIDNGITLCKKCHSTKPKGIKVYEQHNAA